MSTKPTLFESSTTAAMPSLIGKYSDKLLAGFLFVHKYYIIPIYYFFRRKLFRYRKRPSRTILALFSPRGILNECGVIVPVHVWSGETPIDEPYASSSSSDKQDKSTFPMMSPAAAMHRNPST